MTINDEILAAANKLANQGIKPTVALVKTKLSQPVPLPKIISILKTWQHDPNFIEVTNAQSITKQSTTDSAREIELAVSKAIAPLINEIKLLRKEIEILKHEK